VLADAPVHHTHATCYALRGTMRDGTEVRLHSAASDYLKLGTRIKLVGRRTFYGMRIFTIRDTGPALADGHIDLWHPSRSRCMNWGSKPIKFKILPRRR
jgi:3D (Asp-Asp-Asp) domain-containing protein